MSLSSSEDPKLGKHISRSNGMEKDLPLWGTVRGSSNEDLIAARISTCRDQGQEEGIWNTIAS